MCVLVMLTARPPTPACPPHLHAHHLQRLTVVEATTKDAVVKMVKSQVHMCTFVRLSVCMHMCCTWSSSQMVADSIAGAVVAALQPVLQSTLDKTFKASSGNMVEAFEQACREMCLQINQTFNAGTSQCELGSPGCKVGEEGQGGTRRRARKRVVWGRGKREDEEEQRERREVGGRGMIVLVYGHLQ